MKPPSQLKRELDTIKFRLKNNSKQWIDTYPDYKMGLNNNVFNRAQNGLFKTYQDLITFQAKMTGNVDTLNYYLEGKDSNITNIKKEYIDNNLKLKSSISNNLSSVPFKFDKYDETYENLIYLSYYIISGMTLSFFIYKQIKE